VDAEPIMWTCGPAMDLQRCNLRTLSAFYDTAYGNLGAVSQKTDTPAAVATGEREPVVPSRIVVCYRDTTSDSKISYPGITFIFV